MFTNMDTDKSGTITYEELKSGLARLGSKLSETEVQQLMEAVSCGDPMRAGSLDILFTEHMHPHLVFLFLMQCAFQADVDGNGTIDYIEFITATMHRHRLERDEHLFKAFNYFDKDNSGSVPCFWSTFNYSLRKKHG